MALSAIVSAGGSYMAASQQAGADKTAANDQMAMYNRTRQDLLPYMNFGQSALGPMGNLLGLNGSGGSQQALQQLQNYPGYQFAYGQGLQAVDRSAASRGLELSGGQLKDVTQYGQGMADQLVGQYYGQLSGAAGLGEGAAAQTGQFGAQAAQNAGQFTAQAGTAQASGTAGITNSITGFLQEADMAALMASDRRVKDDIKKIGALDSGLPVYSFRYKGSSLPQVGVMADEVRKIAPHAVHRHPRLGVDFVDYKAVSLLPPMRKAA